MFTLNAIVIQSSLSGQGPWTMVSWYTISRILNPCLRTLVYLGIVPPLKSGCFKILGGSNMSTTEVLSAGLATSSKRAWLGEKLVVIIS